MVNGIAETSMWFSNNIDLLFYCILIVGYEYLILCSSIPIFESPLDILMTNINKD